LNRAGRLALHPSDIFGPWSDLPESAKKAIRSLVEKDISLVISLHPRGFLRPWLGRGLYTLSKTLRRAGGPVGLADRVELWSTRVWKAPANLGRKLHLLRRGLAMRWGRKVSVGSLLAGLGRSPDWLLGDFAEDVRVDPRARGFFLEKERNTAWSYLVGIDLIPCPDGVYCVEANLNTAGFTGRSGMAEEVQRGVARLFQTVKNQDFEDLWWWGMDLRPISPWLMKLLQESASSSRINLTVWQDFRVRSDPTLPREGGRPRGRLLLPVKVPPNTLVLRRNSYRVGPDYLISNKEAFVRSVGAVLAETGDCRVRVPSMTPEPGRISQPRGPGLPNLVYKYPDYGKGQGVFFMRVTDAGEAIGIARALDKKMGEPPGLFQPFVCSRLLPGGRVFDVRCEILLSPLGVEMVYAVKRESTKPVPDTLEEGLVTLPGVFTSNLATGGQLTAVEPSELDEITEAALSIGEALASLFFRAFQTV
jgi:hypothetical protein